MNPVIRDACPADVEMVARIYVESSKPGIRSTPAVPDPGCRTDRALAERTPCWAVDPSHWQTGVGRMLMADALERMTQAGYRSAILWTLADYEQGRSFYQLSGWQADGTTRDDGRQVAFRHPLGDGARTAGVTGCR